MDQYMSQASAVIQDNLNQRARGIKAEQATDVKDITHHAQDPKVSHLESEQPVASPNDHIVSQRTEEHRHVLRLKALLIAFGQSQPLLITFQRGFDPASTLIIKGDISQQDGD